MKKQETNLSEELLSDVMEVIKKDISYGDTEGLEEMLMVFSEFHPLIHYLPEEKWDKYESLNDFPE